MCVCVRERGGEGEGERGEREIGREGERERNANGCRYARKQGQQMPQYSALYAYTYKVYTKFVNLS